MLKICDICYTPRVDDNSIRYENKYFCSYDCFQKCMQGKSFKEYEDEIESLKDKIKDIENNFERWKEEHTEVYNQNEFILSHLSEIYYRLNSVYAIDDREKQDEIISELIEYYSDEGLLSILNIYT